MSEGRWVLIKDIGPDDVTVVKQPEGGFQVIFELPDADWKAVSYSAVSVESALTYIRDSTQEHFGETAQVWIPAKPSKTFLEVAMKLGNLVERKNPKYGNAFAKAGEFLKILYPDGIKPEDYAPMLVLVRIFDKQMRIATDSNISPYDDESPWADIAGYGIISETTFVQNKKE